MEKSKALFKTDETEDASGIINEGTIMENAESMTVGYHRRPLKGSVRVAFSKIVRLQEQEC